MRHLPDQDRSSSRSRDTEEPEHQLGEDLTALDLTVFGVGVIIGTGIFVLTGEVAQGERPVRRSRSPSSSPASSARWPPCATPSSPPPCRWPAPPTPSPSPPSASSSPGSSAGTWCWSWRWRCAVVAVGLVRLLQLAAERRLGLVPAHLRSAGDEPAVEHARRVLIVLILTGVLIVGIKLSSRVNLRHRRHQARGRPAGDRRGAVLHQGRQLPPVRPAGAVPTRRPAG